MLFKNSQESYLRILLTLNILSQKFKRNYLIKKQETYLYLPQYWSTLLQPPSVPYWLDIS